MDRHAKALVRGPDISDKHCQQIARLSPVSVDFHSFIILLLTALIDCPVTGEFSPLQCLRTQAFITNHLSISEHVRDVIGKCAQSLYALKLLRNHGMSGDSLRVVYKAVVLSKLLHAAPAWWGFTSAW